MKIQHDIEHEQGGGPPASPSLPRPPRPRGKLWMVLGAVLLSLALLASLGVLLLPGLLQRPAAPARPTATLSAATTPATAMPATPGKTVTPAPATTATTVPMPPTQMSCPPAGTARAVVMAPLVRGSHANVVYVENQGPQNNPTTGMLTRYDTATGSTTLIASLPSPLSDVQVSADGQWVLFRASVDNRPAIQLVRMDGQGLQTVYCTAREVPSTMPQYRAGALEWSPNQQYLAFKEADNVYLLTVATGAYRLEVPASNKKGIVTSYVPVTWLDNTHLYLRPYAATEFLPLDLYLLDITTANMQHILYSSAMGGDFDSSIDGTQLFTCEFPMFSILPGPSSIRVHPVTGGPATTIYRTPNHWITALRVASRTTLLIVIDDNGLWKINTDGTGLSRLTTDPAGKEMTWFNRSTQYVWSTVSRDGSMYAVERGAYDSPTSSLLIGSMSGGAPLTVATGVELVGWTTM